MSFIDDVVAAGGKVLVHLYGRGIAKRGFGSGMAGSTMPDALETGAVVPHCKISRAVGGLVLWTWSVLRGLSGGEIEETPSKTKPQFL